MERAFDGGMMTWDDVSLRCGVVWYGVVVVIVAVVFAAVSCDDTDCRLLITASCKTGQARWAIRLWSLIAPQQRKKRKKCGVQS